jgi:FkbM family methyltransferase
MDAFIDSRFEPLYRKHPLVLVDVGARGGLRSDWRPAEQHLQLIGFEPDVQEYRRLTQHTTGQKVRFFNTALHNRRGTIDIRITRNPALTSVFEPNRDFLDAFPDPTRFDVMEVRQVEASPLDDLLAAEGIDDIDFLKVDTQGSELLVIEGASRALASSAVGVEVEVEFARLYDGQALFAQVDATLRDLGYSLFDLRPCYWKRAAGRDLGGPYGQLVWADALYLKDIAGLRRNVASHPAELAKSKLLRAMSVALLYGYWDYAFDIARDTAACFSPDEHAAILDGLRRSGSARRRWQVPGRHMLAAIFHRLWKLAQPDATGWSVGGSTLGNKRP